MDPTTESLTRPESVTSSVANSFRGGVFAADLPGGRAGASLLVQANGLHAHCDEGSRFAIHSQGLGVERGGASGNMWFCRTPDRALTFFSEAPGFAAALLAMGGNVAAQVQAAQSQLAARQRRWWLYGAVAVAAFLGLAALVPLLYARALDRALAAVPLTVDREIGDFASRSMDLKGPKLRELVVTDAVQAMVDRLTATLGRPDLVFRVQVIDSATVNAFALPGGYIVVYTGLLEKAQSADEVAGVLGHEMAHVVRRHALRRIGSSVGLIAGSQLLLGDLSGVVAVGAELAQAAALSSYSREQEDEADADAAALLHRAGLAPSAFADFFARMNAERSPSALDIGWLRSHAEDGARKAHILAVTATLGPAPPRPLAVQWPAVRARLASTSTKAQNLPATASATTGNQP